VTTLHRPPELEPHPGTPHRALVVLLGLTLLAAGCETRQQALTNGRIRKVEHGLLRAIFLKGQTPEKLSLEARMQFYKVPGVSITIMDRNGLEWSRAYGVRDAHLREPVTEATIFQAGALAQPLAAAAALRLVEQGRLDLDGDVNARLRTWKVPSNEFTERKPVTVREILIGTAGFPEAEMPGFPADRKSPSLMDLLEGAPGAGSVPAEPSSVPGSEVRLSGLGYAVLERLLEDVTLSPFAPLMRQAVLEPLGMKASTFEVPLPEAERIHAASGHGRDGRPIEGKWLDYPAAAADGLWTTPSELLSFASDILQTAMGKDGKILSSGLARAMLSRQAGDRGFGFGIEGTGMDVRFELRGRTHGFACSLDVYPYKGQGAVIMTNSDNGALLRDEILRAVSAAYEWPDFKAEERPLYRLEPSIYEQYVGRYRVTPDYELNVRYEDYYLVIQPTGQAPTRFYVESSTFFFSIDPYIRIQFLTDGKGKVTGLILWQQDFKQEAEKIG
jgi:CubicO group peptidase (beta-lactamase class C family)